MAFKQSLTVKCDTSGCKAVARIEVFNHFGVPQGKYCQFCGEHRLRELIEYEKEYEELKKQTERSDSLATRRK